MIRLLILFAILLSAAAPARATWFEATTPHFIINAEGTEANVRDFAARLERFDQALRYIYRREEDPSRRSNRVRVYAVSPSLIRVLCGGCRAGTVGFYRSRAGGSVIFTTALAGRGDRASARNLELDPQEVLFHEYSHHFMFSSFPHIVFPMWFTEGFADFNANLVSMPNGDIYLGTPANYRAYGLRLGSALPTRSLLAPNPGDLKNGSRHEAIYGRGWLLMHFLILDNARRPQLDDYLKRLMKGEDSIAAGTAAFGDLRALDDALNRYMNGKLNTPLLVPAVATTPAVKIRPLSAGAAAMMWVHLRSTAGVDAAQAARIVVEAEARAVPFPADATVQNVLAEAEFDAGNLDKADSACDRAIAVDLKNVTALLRKGQIATRRLVLAGSKDADAWQQARRWIAKANRADTEAAAPLIAFYETYLAQGVPPPKLAVDGLAKASDLAGEDRRVNWLLARHLIAEGDTTSARVLLRAIAYAPHANPATQRARRIVDLIDAGKMQAATVAFDAPDEADAVPPADTSR